MNDYRGIVKGLEGVKRRWAFGDRFTIEDRVFIVPDDAEYDDAGCVCKNYGPAISGFIEVIPETVGQCTGKKDINGKKIYAGDVLKGVSAEYPVTRDNDYAKFVAKKGCFILDVRNWGKCLTIGNIHDTPSLLDKEKT